MSNDPEFAEDETAALNLRSSLSQFTFTSPSLRRSPRKHGRVGDFLGDQEDYPSPPVTPRKRRTTQGNDSPASGSRDSSLSPKKLKTSRGYAAPETYAHLRVLQDYLKEDLDVMFCGINPGYMSAVKGHHFANPTNHFWRCLHQSGFTPSLLPPAKDFTLPSEYNLGLTDLVDRPSTEQAELSTAEMIASVPAFLKKVRKWRPRVVCFVGRGIWLCVEKGLQKLCDAPPPETPKSPKKKGGKKNKDEGYMLQPYRVVHTGTDESGTVNDTFFFVIPSTSGRVVSHQLNDKIKLFSTLHDVVEQIKAGTLETENFVDVALPKAEAQEVSASLLSMESDNVKTEEIA